MKVSHGRRRGRVFFHDAFSHALFERLIEVEQGAQLERVGAGLAFRFTVFIFRQHRETIFFEAEAGRSIVESNRPDERRRAGDRTPFDRWAVSEVTSRPPDTVTSFGAEPPGGVLTSTFRRTSRST